MVVLSLFVAFDGVGDGKWGSVTTWAVWFTVAGGWALVESDYDSSEDEALGWTVSPEWSRRRARDRLGDVCLRGDNVCAPGEAGM